MGRVHPHITPALREFIAAQHLFFVATAPLAAEGHVNVSPKGVDGTSLLVDEHTFAYLDITASGAETIAHLRENGRVTVMFCAFDGKPDIVRLHGRILVGYAERKGAEGVRAYQRERNATSIDGLPALVPTEVAAQAP